MYPQVCTRDPSAVESEVEAIYSKLFADARCGFVGRAFFWAIECFAGNHRGYQAIDARYHDLEHTLQGALCMVRLLEGRVESGHEPLVSRRLFELGLLAILLHDTGYLKKKGDDEGTGAKYTLTHVQRSAEFAEELLRDKGFSEEEIQSVQRMIRCTGVNADLNAIPFEDEAERMMGFSLGTADLLGQMAAEDYVEKLPILFEEFAESQRYNKGNPALKMTFSSADELMQKTPGFWQFYVQPKINKDFLELYRYLNRPYPGGANGYLEKIQANLQRLEHEYGATMPR